MAVCSTRSTPGSDLQPGKDEAMHSSLHIASPAAQSAWQPSARQPRRSVRVLIVPGLRDSGPAHWQTWLQSQYVDA
ncbi:alpha/beta hydrolase, partial [Aquabacterium sp. UBA2148]|uniref:alpha/beta hydrolase n=1 Tax=Aquabacterium sp. UBA2148 TaxID=1946042 RepID=UPI0032E3B3C6